MNNVIQPLRRALLAAVAITCLSSQAQAAIWYLNVNTREHWLGMCRSDPRFRDVEQARQTLGNGDGFSWRDDESPGVLRAERSDGATFYVTDDRQLCVGMVTRFLGFEFTIRQDQ